MLTQSGVVDGMLVSVDRRVAARDHRPCARVSGRFAGEVSGVELRDGGVEVVEVEYDDRRDLIVRVDFEDAQRIRLELLGPAIAARGAREDEALPTGCDDNGRYVHEPGVGGRPQVLRSRHLDRVGSLRLRPAGDHR